MRRQIVLFAPSILILFLGPAAFARSSSVVPYPVSDVWPTAIRFLRVDRGATIREKDAESGYVLFDVSENSRSYKGSLELVRTTDGDGREATRVVTTLPDLPRHFEVTLLEKLATKVKDEYGSPAPAPPRKPTSGEPARRPTPDCGPPRLPNGDLPRAPMGELPR